MTRQMWIGAAAIAGVVAGSSAWLMGDTSRVDVTTASVTSGSVVRAIVATGTLQAVTTVEVGSQVSGNIQELDADFNSIVRKDQIVARIDPSLFQSQLAQSRATLEAARANLAKSRSDLAGTRVQLEDAQQKYTRAKALADKQIELQSDLDAAAIALDSAKATVVSQQATVTQQTASVAAAEAAVKQDQVNVDHCVIRAPINGIVIQRSVDVGQTVAASVQAPVLFIIAADLTRMQMEVDIDESDIAGPTPGEPVNFQVEAYPDETFRGAVSQIRLQPVAEQTITATAVGGPATANAATTAVATVVGYATMISVDNPDERLRPGMTATVSLAGQRRDNVVRLPSSALSFRPSPDLEATGHVAAAPSATDHQQSGDSKPRTVWRYEAGRFIPVAVHTGLADQLWTELVSGSLKPGDVVVTNAVVHHSTRLMDHVRPARSGTLG